MDALVRSDLRALLTDYRLEPKSILFGNCLNRFRNFIKINYPKGKVPLPVMGFLLATRLPSPGRRSEHRVLSPK